MPKGLDNRHEAMNSFAEPKKAKLTAEQQVILLNWENEMENLLLGNDSKKIAELTKKITNLKWKGIVK